MSLMMVKILLIISSSTEAIQSPSHQPQLKIISKDAAEVSLTVPQTSGVVPIPDLLREASWFRENNRFGGKQPCVAL